MSKHKRRNKYFYTVPSVYDYPHRFEDGGIMDKVSAVGGGLTSIIGSSMNNAQIADTTSIEGKIDDLSHFKAVSTTGDDLLEEWLSAPTLNKVDYNDIRGGSTGSRLMNTLNSTISGASSGAKVGGGYGAIAGAVVGLGSAIGGWISGGVKAKRKQQQLNEQIEQANAKKVAELSNAAGNIHTQQGINLGLNYAAYGGPLLFEPANRFSEGGNLYTSVPNIGQHGGNFSNGVTIIGNGGTHEENPMEGVPMGMSPDGTPNLVEQGETKFNNYIFSDRLSATKQLLAAYNLPTSYAGQSFSNIAKKLSKESSERPNDPISKRGLESTMIRLQQAQEQVRVEKNRNSNKYAHGGKMGIKYDGLGGMPNFLQFYTPQERRLRSLQRQGTFPTYEYPVFQKEFSRMTPQEREASLHLEVPSFGDTRSSAERWADENIKPLQYNPLGTPSNTKGIISDDTITNSSRQDKGAAWLRYAPVVGAGLGVMSDLAGLTNKPDYSNADLIGDIADNLTDIEAKPIGNYLTYRPLDRNYYLNKLNAEAGATRRAIVNQSGGNRASAMAGLLAADYNALGRIGDFARQAEEYNMAQRERVEAFNRGTNQFNAELALKAATAKQGNDELRLKARTTQAQLRDQADARSAAGRTANLTNLFDSLGDIGREEFSRNMIQTNPALYYSIDSSGRITYKNGYDDLSEAEKKVVRDAATKAKSKKKAKGGYLTIRKGK